MKTRACGSCNACCTSLTIHELDKPAHTPCKHLNTCGKGCGIYESRPGVCRVFRCGWLDGKIDAGMRPDRCGIIVWGAGKELDPEGELIVVQETRPGALSESRNLNLVRQMMKKSPLAISTRSGRQDWFGPPEKLERVRHLHVLPETLPQVPCTVSVSEKAAE